MLSYVRKSIVLGATLMTIQPTISAEIADNRLYGIVCDKSTPEEQTQGVNQTARNLGHLIGAKALAQLPYIDLEGQVYPAISAFPFIIMKGKPGPLTTLASLSVEEVTMVSISNTVTAFGSTSILQPLTKKFSIFKPTSAVIQPVDLSSIEALSEDGIASIALVDQDLESGKALNALAHMSVGAGSTYTGDLTSLAYDWVGTTSQGHIAKFTNALSSETVTLVRFLDTMHLGPTYREQIAATLARTPKVTGIYAIGAAAVLKKALLLLK